MWSPDGKRLLFLGAGGEDRFIVGRVRPKQAPVARRITRTDFRDDESGLLGRRTHLWTVAARPGARPRRLTHGDFDVEEPTWAPDGSWIAFTADMGDDWNVMPRTALYRVPSGGGAFSLLAELPGDAWNAAISPDGRTRGLPGDRCRRSARVRPDARLAGAGGRWDAALPDARAGSVRRQRGVG